jgi:hypothetical protein
VSWTHQGLTQFTRERAHLLFIISFQRTYKIRYSAKVKFYSRVQKYMTFRETIPEIKVDIGSRFLRVATAIERGSIVKERSSDLIKYYPCHWTHLRMHDFYPCLPVERPRCYPECSDLCCNWQVPRCRLCSSLKLV